MGSFQAKNVVNAKPLKGKGHASAKWKHGQPRWLEQREKGRGRGRGEGAAETTGRPLLRRGAVKSDEGP